MRGKARNDEVYSIVRAGMKKVMTPPASFTSPDQDHDARAHQPCSPPSSLPGPKRTRTDVDVGDKAEVLADAYEITLVS